MIRAGGPDEEDEGVVFAVEECSDGEDRGHCADHSPQDVDPWWEEAVYRRGRDRLYLRICSDPRSATSSGRPAR